MSSGSAPTPAVGSRVRVREGLTWGWPSALVPTDVDFVVVEVVDYRPQRVDECAVVLAPALTVEHHSLDVDLHDRVYVLVEDLAEQVSA